MDVQTTNLVDVVQCCLCIQVLIPLKQIPGHRLFLSWSQEKIITNIYASPVLYMFFSFSF